MNNVPLAWIEAYNQGYNDCLAKFVDTHPADLTDEEIKILKEIIRITDRKHDLWDKAKEFLK